MFMMKKFLLTFLLIAGFILVSEDISAQCAMCRAAVESNLKEGGDAVGGGLNSGILYLMAIPYLIFTVIGISWYKQSRRNKVQKMA